MLDNQAYGAQKALTVHAISPAFPYDIETARLQSAGRDEVRVVLAADERLMPDLALVLKTEKYVRLKNSPSLTENERRIIESKVRLNTARKKEVIERLRKAIGTGTLIVNAEDVPSPSTDAISHVEDGLAALVGKVFPNLNLLGGITYTETDIAKYAKSDEGMIGTESLSKLTPVTNEVLSRVEMLRNQGELVTVKRLVDVFESKPFGWPFAATLVAMAQLLASSALSASLDGTVVRKPDCAAVLRNTAKQSQTVLSVPEVFDPNKVQSLKAFCIEFFDDGAVPADPLDLAKHLADKLRDKRDSLAFLVKGSQYPFMTQLARPVALLDAACGKALDWYFKDFNSHIDELLETKQNLIVPISAFVNDGGQKAIYDEARAVLVSHKNNISYLSEGSDADVRKGLEDPNIFRGMRMPQLKKAVYTLNSLLTEEIAARKAGAAEVIDDRRAQLRASADYGRADERQREGVDRRIQSVIDAIDGQDQIAQVIQIRTSFEEKVYPALLDTLQPIPPGPEPKQKVTVMIGAINVSTGLKVLDSVVDVDRYLDDLRCVLLSTIEDNKRIAL